MYAGDLFEDQFFGRFLQKNHKVSSSHTIHILNNNFIIGIIDSHGYQLSTMAVATILHYLLPNYSRQSPKQYCMVVALVEISKYYLCILHDGAFYRLYSYIVVNNL